MKKLRKALIFEYLNRYVSTFSRTLGIKTNPQKRMLTITDKLEILNP